MFLFPMSSSSDLHHYHSELTGQYKKYDFAKVQGRQKNVVKKKKEYLVSTLTEIICTAQKEKGEIKKKSQFII